MAIGELYMVRENTRNESRGRRMIIRGASAENFKSFRSFDVSMGDYNLIIGANAAGKSNFTSYFRFLSDIHEHGLLDAILKHGGADYVRHIQLPKDTPISLKVRLVQRNSRARFFTGLTQALMPGESTYTLRLAFSRRGGGVRVLEDTFETNVSLYEVSQRNTLGDVVGQGHISVVKQGDKIDVRATGIPEDMMRYLGGIAPAPPESVLLDKRLWWLATYSAGLGPGLFRIGSYDFDPRLSKHAISVAGRRELETDGSNLALALKSLLGNKEQNRKLHNLMQSLLPFVQKVDVIDQHDKSVLLGVLERYFGSKQLPASVISDGTINIVALIVALYFEDASTITLEEPERNVHPHLMSKMVQMMKEASKSKQLLVTTHNPEMVKFSGLDGLLLVSRGEDGASAISYPKDSTEVQTFLQQEMGLEELYVQDMLR